MRLILEILRYIIKYKLLLFNVFMDRILNLLFLWIEFWTYCLFSESTYRLLLINMCAEMTCIFKPALYIFTKWKLIVV